MPKPIPHEKWDQVCQTYRSLRSLRATARAVGMGKTSVEYILKARGVPRFPRNRKGAENSAVKAIMAAPECPSAKVRSPALMADLYVARKLSTTEIAARLGVSPATVRVGLMDCEIPLRTRSEALRGKARPSVRGPANAAWRGGVTSWRKRARGGLSSSFVRSVMERDDFACQWCGSRRTLVVHHHQRSFMDIVNLVRGRFPDLGDDDLTRQIVDEHCLDDGITLCKKCHDEHHRGTRGSV